jgi:hypothetical protein
MIEKNDEIVLQIEKCEIIENNDEKLKDKIIKSQNLKHHLRIVMNIYLKILKSEKLWENNQDLLKYIHHFFDIMLNEKSRTLIEIQIFGLKENLYLH